MQWWWRVDPIDDPSEHRGEGDLVVRLQPSRTAADRATRARWIEFFAEPRPLHRVRVHGRLSQELLEQVGRQASITHLELPSATHVTSLVPLAPLTGLEHLEIGRASQIDSLAPLADLNRLRSLLLLTPSAAFDVTTLGGLTSLRELRFGVGGFGSRRLAIPDLLWLRSLTSIEVLELYGVTLADPDLSPVRALPALAQLRLPLLRGFRPQIRDHDGSNRAIAQLAQAFADYDAMPRG